MTTVCVRRSANPLFYFPTVSFLRELSRCCHNGRPPWTAAVLIGACSCGYTFAWRSAVRGLRPGEGGALYPVSVGSWGSDHRRIAVWDLAS